MFLRTISLITTATVCFVSLNGFNPLPSLADPIPDRILAQNAPEMEETKPDRLIQKLNLTPEQQQKIKDIRSKYRGQISQQMTEFRTERQKLQELMAGNASNDELRSQHQQVAQTKDQLENLHFESMLEMRAVLTPEQRVQFAQMVQQRRQKYTRGLGGFRRGQL
jgi:Spy/CpxP family protein refolding chaperone